MITDEPDTEKELRNVQRMPLAFLTVFFAVFGLGFFVSPAFNALVSQAFGGLHDAVVTMVAWCRSL